ncbi:MAG: hypothetical protein NTX61_14130 [Bacteroidetes bacterium]|nr:hypothetical protein [Bacteroidota bacterium]
MCFSPEASFAGGVVISAIGIFTILKVHKPSQIIFASIPLFFGVQQIAEGFLWLTLPYPEYLIFQKISTYLFLMMAEVIWPVMIPLSVLLMEKNTRKRKIVWAMLGLGISVSMYYGFCLLFFHVTPRVNGFHIKYFTDFPQFMANVAVIVYMIATITPLFISSIKRMFILGILMSLSCLITVLFFRLYLASVWCFFAALISGVIYWILSDSKKKFNFDKLRRVYSSDLNPRGTD